MLKNISQFICFIALQSVMDQLNWQIDKFILARTQGTSEISIYSIGSTFNTYFLMIGGAVSGIFIAEINRLVVTGDEIRLNRLFRRTCKLFTYLVGFIITVFLIFGRPFVLRWAGAEYSQSFKVGWMLMLPVSFSMVMGLGQDIARAKNRHQIQIIINVCVCVGNMLISIPLAIHFGAVGSAFGTFIAEIIICMIVQPVYYKKVLGLEVKSIFLDVVRYLPGLVLPVVFGAAINYFGLLKENYVSIMFYGIIYAIIYMVCLMLFSMGRDDRKYVQDIVKKRKI